MKKFSKTSSKGLLLMLAAVFSCGFLAAQQQYTTSRMESNGNWTIPANVSKVKVEAWGGGGAGGYVSGGFLNYRASGGGGGGAYAGNIFSVDLNGTTKILVSNIRHGESNATSSRVTDGGNTTVEYKSLKVVAEGGKSVTGTNNTTGAQGGKAENSIGIWKFSGGNGSNGTHGSIGGGGGGAAGSQADGEDGENSTAFSADGGASGGDLGGDGGQGRTGASSPTAGSKYGGGGSGVVSSWTRTKTGGAGAIGVVRFTYMPFYINNASVAVTTGGQVDVTPVSNLTGLKYRVENQGTNNSVSYTVNVDITDKITISNASNTSDAIQTVTIKLAGVWTDNIDTERGFDTLTRFFLVTLDIYPAITPGTIGEEIVTCTATDTIKKFTNVEPAVGQLKADGTNNPYCWQFSEDNATWTIIAGATGETYTPNGETNKTGWFRRGAYNAAKDTVYSNAIHTTVGNVQPGEISMNDGATEQGEYCIDEEINIDIKANPVIENAAYQSNYTIQWQKRINAGEWKDIEGAAGDEYTETFKLATANDGGIADSVHIRYLFKFAECAVEPSNNVYKQKILVANDYYSPVLTKDQEITLWYGACDTAIVIPTLDPEPISISCSPTRIGVGTTTVTWTVREPCGGLLTYEQKFTVNYPECEQNVDINGVSYPVVRVGCECWTAKNLNSETETSKVYNNDQSNEQFGRLYSWYEAMGIATGDNESAPATKESMRGEYVQGICPEGWAIPSISQYDNLSTMAGGSEKLKTSDVSAWLPDAAGIEPVSGFNAMGSGYYDSQINAFYRLLGVTQFWTSEVIEHTVKGVCSRINHSCPDIRFSEENKTMHLSVRCVRIEPKQ